MRSQQMHAALGAPSGACHGILCPTQVCICVILGRAVTEWMPVLWLEKARGQELDLENTV